MLHIHIYDSIYLELSIYQLSSNINLNHYAHPWAKDIKPPQIHR